MISIVVGLVLQMASPAQAQQDAAVRDARSAQARFETTRRMNLRREPRDPGHPCHAFVGRYCFWSDGEEANPPIEPANIVRARDRLLSVLDSALERNPSSAWLHGQVTRYLIEAGRAAHAVERARTCGAVRWWCAALEGLALHVSEQYHEADSIFTVALDSMPTAQRCEWTDLHILVNARLAREIERATCAEREAMATLLWTLAKPAWTTPGNDLRTEHFARRTMAEIQTNSAIGHGMRFGDDSHELMIRYGWSEWFTRQEPSPGLSTLSSVSITGHGREPSYAFFPDIESLRNWPRLTPQSWSFRDTLSRTFYAPRHVKRISALPHQLARFWRGDSLEVAVAYEVTEPVLARDALTADIAVLHDRQIRARGSERVTGDAPRGALRFTVPRDSMIVSIEVRGDSSRRWSRARYTIDPLNCSLVCVSDIVLFAGEKRSEVTDLDSALAFALTDMRHSVRKPLGVYWEVAGAEIPGDMDVSLMVTPVKVTRARRIAVALRLAREQSPVRLRWQASRRIAESVVLRLPSAARGKYRVVLTIDTPDGPQVTSSREIELVP